RRRHTRCLSDWSSDVCSSDLISASGGSRSASTIKSPSSTSNESPAALASSIRRCAFIAETSCARLPGRPPDSQPSHRHKPQKPRSEEHTSELQSLRHLVCRLL